MLPGAADSLAEGEHRERRCSSPGQGLRRAPSTGPAPPRPSCLHGHPVSAPHPKAPGSPRNPTLCPSAPCSAAPQLTPAPRLESCSSPGDTGVPSAAPEWLCRAGHGGGGAWLGCHIPFQPKACSPHRGTSQGLHSAGASPQGRFSVGSHAPEGVLAFPEAPCGRAGPAECQAHRGLCLCLPSPWTL